MGVLGNYTQTRHAFLGCLILRSAGPQNDTGGLLAVGGPEHEESLKKSWSGDGGIVLLSAEGSGDGDRSGGGECKCTVDRWQERYVARGLAGLQRDATRRGRKPPLAAAMIERAVKMTLHGEAHPPRRTGVPAGWPRRSASATRACSGFERTRARKPYLGPRFHMHFTPTSASWLNQVERLGEPYHHPSHPPRCLQECGRARNRLPTIPRPS